MTKNKDDLIKIDGMKQASELLSGVDESTRRRILSEISAQNPALAEQLKKQMVSIETVLMLPSPDLLKIIDQLSDTLIALALRGITPELVEQFFDKI